MRISDWSSDVCSSDLTPYSVSASTKKSPITPFKPSALSTKGVDATATDFAKAIALASKAGYDGVEIMGSEGYLINQMLAARTKIGRASCRERVCQYG